MEKMLKCEECIFALKNSDKDRCDDLSLITMKQYGVSIDFETTRKGLTEPSGTVRSKIAWVKGLNYIQVIFIEIS